MSLSKEKINVLAKASNINTYFELPPLLEVLEKQGIIDISSKGDIQVLGVTSSSILNHTSDIFDTLNPEANEMASIELAERASILPILTSDISEEISDKYKLSESNTINLIEQAEIIGFVDVEKISEDEKLLFNGNLFRRDNPKKVLAVMDSLKDFEKTKLLELNDMLRLSACIPVDLVKKQLGNNLFEKVTAIGLYDISIVSNSTENMGYITLPAAFSKYSNSMVDDAFDLAKAFVSSITYGMTKSSYVRGKIQMVDKLLSALVRGESVGPVKAIAEDYKVLEFKGVVQVYQGSKGGRSGPMLKLLKKEIGELALQVIRSGDASEHSLDSLPTAAVTSFKGPEANRNITRREQLVTNPKSTHDMLSILRTGVKL